MNKEISEILLHIPPNKTKSLGINFHETNIGRFEISHEIEKYRNEFLDEERLIIKPFEGYREIGFVGISRVLFNKGNTTGIYFVKKLLYNETAIEMIIVEKESNSWHLKEKILLKG